MIEEAINLICKRFTNKDWGYIYDYAREDGYAQVPTADECKKGIPNPYSWLTPISNGTFFSSIYCIGLLELREKSNKSKYDDIIQKQLDWLFRAQDVGHTDGFIARAVATDGAAHYLFSSEDQAGPWLYALWKAYKSSYTDNQKKQIISERLIKTIDGIISHGWCVPGDGDIAYVPPGELLKSQYRKSALVLFCLAIAYELTGNEKYRSEYYEQLIAIPEGGALSRIEIMEFGFAPDMVNDAALRQFWITIIYHLMAHEISELEKGDTRQRIKHGLVQNAYAALPRITDYQSFKEEEIIPFCYTWDELKMIYKPCTNSDEAMEMGQACYSLMGNRLGERTHENCIREATCAAWIVGTSGQARMQEKAKQVICDLLKVIPWDRLSMSHVIFAFSAYTHLL